MSYCAGAAKATIDVTVGSEFFKVISNHPPVEVIIESTGEGTFENYTHSMDQPINKTFNKAVSSVILNDPINDYVYSGQYPPSDPSVHRTCPIPSIDGNRIYSDFDPGAYSDNSGTCTYKVFFGGWQLTISDTNGQVFKKSYEQKPKFTVACDDDCPEGSHKCIHNQYPGYCCVPCREVANRINNIAKKIR